MGQIFHLFCDCHTFSELVNISGIRKCDNLFFKPFLGVFLDQEGIFSQYIINHVDNIFSLTFWFYMFSKNNSQQARGVLVTF
jgi:hypothetical protein